MATIERDSPCEQKFFEVLSDFFKKLFIYLWPHWVFTAAHRLSLVAASGSYSLAAVHEILIAVASLVAEHRL